MTSTDDAGRVLEAEVRDAFETRIAALCDAVGADAPPIMNYDTVPPRW